MNEITLKAWRFWLIALVLLLLLLALFIRLIFIQVLDTDRGVGFLQRQGDSRSVRKDPVEAYRGVITDRKGVPIAMSTPVASIWFDPEFFNPTHQQLTIVARILQLPLQDIQEKQIIYAAKRFAYLRKGVSPSIAKQLDKLEIKGLHAKYQYKRYYPAGEVTANLLGYTQHDGKGVEGVEFAYDDWLKGKAGYQRVVKDLYQRTIKVLDQPQDPKHGQNIELSIDLSVQFLAYKALKRAVNFHAAQAGSIVVLDNQTGEVLAMASLPSFNPNDRRNLTMAGVRQRAVTDVFEPASTIKPLAMLAILESGQFKINDEVSTHPGFMRIGNKTLLDPVNYGKLDLTGIITKSSQVGIAKLAIAHEPLVIPSMLTRLGFGHYVGTGIPGESGGRLPFETHWSPLEQAALAYGYGLTVNTLQLAKAYAVIGSKGASYPISLLKLNEPAIAKQVVSEVVADQVKAMLQSVTGPLGTGKRARTSSYSVAGKTGTSHKVGKGGYELNYVSLFAGLAPADNPRISIAVAIDDPQGSRYYGGEVAAPLFAEVAEDTLRLLGEAPDLINGKEANLVAMTGARK